MSRIICIFLLILMGNGSMAQSFQWQASLPPIEKDGFYKIALAPEITSHIKKDLSDIRLYGNTEEIPYILGRENPVEQKNLFREYRIVENSAKKNCCTHLILENTNRNTINNISLIIRNADVRKRARLSGSDDMANWFVIRERYNLEGVYSNQKTYEARMLDFPLSNYAYYRLEIDDSTSSQLQILKAGYYDTYAEIGKYISLEEPKIIQRDSSDRKSYLWVKFNAPQIIDKLGFLIGHPPYYHRQVTINTARYDKRGRQYLVPIHYFEISSSQEREIATNFQADEFYVVIDNKDNPPLKINDVQAYQLTRYLTAYLKAGEKYLLRYGNEKVRKPDYDIVFYNDSIPGGVPVLQAIAISRIPMDVDEAPKGFFSSSLWIWAAIGLVIVVLGYMSWRMVGELGSDSKGMH